MNNETIKALLPTDPDIMALNEAMLDYFMAYRLGLITAANRMGYTAQEFGGLTPQDRDLFERLGFDIVPTERGHMISWEYRPTS